MTIPACVCASGSVYFSTDFSKDALPEGMTTVSLDDKALIEKGYKESHLPEPAWGVQSVGTRGTSAVVATHAEDGTCRSTELVLPSFKVAETGAILRWSGKSVLPDFPNDYKVVVRQGNSVGILEEVKAENYDWTVRSVSLDSYVGQTVSIAFITEGAPGYMLAIDDIFAGVPDAPLLQTSNKTPIYYGPVDNATVSVSVENHGSAANISKFVCKAGNDIVGESAGLSIPFGKTAKVDINVPLELNKHVAYTVCAVNGDGTETSLSKGDLFSSHFARTLLLDKATGMWCNNCPDGILTANKLKRRFGDSMIVLESHANPDILECADYWTNLKFYSVPYMMLDRNRQTASSSDKQFDNEYWQPVTAEVKGVDFKRVSTWAEVKFAIRFAEDLDNSTDRYRFGFTYTTSKFPESKTKRFYQSNMYNSPRYDEYYFLDSRIPAGLVKMHDVVLTGEYAFGQIEGMLPEQIKAGEEYPVEFDADCPDGVEKLEDARLVVYVLDYITGRVLNCAAMNLDGNFTSAVESLPADNTAEESIAVRYAADGNFYLMLGDDAATWKLEVRDISGRLIFAGQGEGDGVQSVPAQLPAGVSIATLSNSKGEQSTIKILK